MKNKCIIELENAPKYCNPLTVSENKGQLRLVIDLRNINELVIKHKFKYEDLSTLSEVLDKNDYFQRSI